MLRRFHIAFLIWFLPSITIAQTIVIEGHVVDQQDQPLIAASVQVLNKYTGRIIAFNITGQKGDFSLLLHHEDSLRLKLDYLGFETFICDLSLDSMQGQPIISKKIKLQPKQFLMDELTISGSTAIIIKTDTIVFDVSHFTNGTENVAEDVLKKLPGVQITEEGSIKVNGKAIETLMIDGDDLVGRQYAILSKNLSAKLIDKVEIIDKFQYNRLHKGINQSDKIAINIRLNKGPKASLFGNSEFGFGNKGFYEARLNTISLLNKFKIYSFSSANNIGEDDGQSNSLASISGNTSGSGQSLGEDVTLSKIIQLGYNLPNLKKNRYTFNQAKLANIHLLYSPNKKIKTKSSISLANDLVRFFNQTTQQFLLGSRGAFSENYNSRNSFFASNIEFSLTWDKSDKERIEYWVNFGKATDQNNARLQFNQNPIVESLSSELIKSDYYFNYSKKVDDNKLFSISIRHKLNTLPQQYSADALLFNDLFPHNDSNSNIQQKNNIKLNYKAIEIRYLNKIQKHTWDSKMLFSEYSNTFNSYLGTIKNTNDSLIGFGSDFLNNFTNQTIDLCFSNNYNYHLNKKLSMYSKIELHQIWNKNQQYPEQNLHTKNIALFPNFKLGLSFQPEKKHHFLLSYDLHRGLSSVNEIYPKYMLKDYRSLSKGLGAFEFSNNSSLLFNYTYGSWIEGFLANMNFIFHKPYKYFSTKTTITDLFSQSETILLQNKKYMYLYNTSIDQYIKIISCNLKVNGTYSQNAFLNYVNDIPRTIIFNNVTFSTELRSVFQDGLNFHLGMEWRQNSYLSPIKLKNSNFNTFIDLSLSISKSILIEVKNDLQYLGNANNSKQSYLFIDGSLQFATKKRLAFQLNANNIFNVKAFKVFSFNEIASSTSTYRLLPRCIMVKINFGF
ncbi:hypothetical protein [Haliscomenobacter sp.]|uniref:hypothetical protein n=1 Tax=Haliscomenobacter sp. TaxID=2717303 RepID=UPI00336506BC